MAVAEQETEVSVPPAPTTTTELVQGETAGRAAETEPAVVMSENTVVKVKLSLEDAKDMIQKQTNEIAVLRSKLDNTNADMDTTLKNLNNEQVRNAENEKKLADLEQANSLLQIKSGNAEKSLREQSREITSLNQRVREFTDLSSQYKAQIVENKTLRHKEPHSNINDYWGIKKIGRLFLGGF